ncbi:alpha/beta fold hydrolase [Nonlabens antarcticus]|uniref:alpha/beta fold hydrolase n=1 Tax=Nonlabens antarcticus TaxID=392714 RepID=UPI00189137C3|nr:alpha/beta fold hydrolase [Nonlabens antarcticus]
MKYIYLQDLQLRSGKKQNISVSYQIFGRELHSAPIILVNHALTGNSSVTDWWSPIVGAGKTIDLDQFTVLALDIPGNGFDSNTEHLIYNYQDFCLADVALAFAKAIESLKIYTIDLGVGGSIGGALLWEILAIRPKLFKTIVPIAADWKATDWLMACCHVQETILSNSNKPLQTARQHAMTFYRSPQGLKNKFNREVEGEDFQVKAWLNFHGTSLEKRFVLPSYRLLNHLLWNTDASRNYYGKIEQMVAVSDTRIELIAIDSDGFFLASEDQQTYELLKGEHEIDYHEIKSLHGHDAFLIEHDQVSQILSKIIINQLNLSLVDLSAAVL